jgi:drug/metabolite transporter (DMT)-like permease
MALGTFWFAAMSVLVKLSGQRLPSMQVVFVRAVLTLALSVWLVRRAGVRPALGRRHRPLLLRGLFGSVALSCFYYSLVHLPLAEATVVQYTNPVFTALLAAWLLGERFHWAEAACAAASLAGVVLVAQPAALFGRGGAAIPTGAAAVALLGALCSAVAYVMVRRVGTSESPLVVVLYLPLVTVPLSLPFAVARWTWPTPAEWLALVGVGITTQVAQLHMTRGLQLETASRATAVGYLQIVFAAAWGALLFGQWPNRWAVLGAALIVGSTLAVARLSRDPVVVELE